MSSNIEAVRTKVAGEYYLTGRTALFSLSSDPRFSFCLFVPSIARTTTRSLPLVVIQHGTMRNVMEYRDVYVEAAESNGWVLLAPLFPAQSPDLEGLLSFHRLRTADAHYDEVLLDMVAQAASMCPVDGRQFAFHGFSGGGQFGHRFFYAHPDRLTALSIGAPGHVTLIDDRAWWAGTGDLIELLGVDVDVDAMAAVPIQFVVGAEDTDTWELTGLPPGSWQDNADEIGPTRLDRVNALRENWASHGIMSQLNVVPGLAHQGLEMGPTVTSFLEQALSLAATT